MSGLPEPPTAIQLVALRHAVSLSEPEGVATIDQCPPSHCSINNLMVAVLTARQLDAEAQAIETNLPFGGPIPGLALGTIDHDGTTDDAGVADAIFTPAHYIIAGTALNNRCLASPRRNCSTSSTPTLAPIDRTMTDHDPYGALPSVTNRTDRRLHPRTQPGLEAASRLIARHEPNPPTLRARPPASFSRGAEAVRRRMAPRSWARRRFHGRQSEDNARSDRAVSHPNPDAIETRWKMPPLPAKRGTPPKTLPISTKLATIPRLDAAEDNAE